MATSNADDRPSKFDDRPVWLVKKSSDGFGIIVQDEPLTREGAKALAAELKGLDVQVGITNSEYEVTATVVCD